MLNSPGKSSDGGRMNRVPLRSAMTGLLMISLLLCLAYLFMPFVRSQAPVPDEPAGSRYETLPAPSSQRMVPEESPGQPGQVSLPGQPVEAAEAGETRPADTPDSRLELELHGTFVSSDVRLAYAIIAGPAGDEGYYSVGDQVADGITVHEILADAVILMRNQRYETLRFLRDGGEDSAIQAGSTQPGSDSGPVFRERGKSLVDLIRPQPVRIEGKFAGFRLKPVNNDNPLRESGLQPGDVVTWINEVDIDNPLKGMRVMRSISSGDYVNMTVRRNGQEFSLSFHMPQ